MLQQNKHIQVAVNNTSLPQVQCFYRKACNELISDNGSSVPIRPGNFRIHTL